MALRYRQDGCAARAWYTTPVRLLPALALTGSAFSALIALVAIAALGACGAWWLASYAGAVGLLSGGIWLWASRGRRQLLTAALGVTVAILLARIAWTRSLRTTSISSWRISRGPSSGGSLLPEGEMMAIGVEVLPRLWRWPPTALRDHHLRDAVNRQYAELDGDPETRGLESVLLAQAFNTAAAAGHYFLVLPKTPPPERGFPTVLFLHGFGGNSQLYVGWFRDVAKRFELAAVLPTGSFAGSWWQSGDQVAAWAALGDASLHHPLDLSRVVVGGLSNGGVGAAGLARSPRFVGLLSVAAYPPTADAVEGIGGKPAVFLGARDDDRFPIAGLHRAAAALRQAGSAVEVIETAGDHLAVVQDPSQLADALQKLCWLGAKVCER